MKIYSLIFCILLISCREHSYIKKKVKINTQYGEQCFYFSKKRLDTVKFNRRVKIVKNTLNDTVLFGYGILAPQQVGYMEYSRLGNREDVLLDLDYKNPKASRICVSPYKNKEVKGVLVLKLDTL